MIKMDNDRKNAIRAACKNWRLENRFTMSAIARTAGVSRQAIRSFENDRGLSVKILAGYVNSGMPVSIIMDAADVSISDILGV